MESCACSFYALSIEYCNLRAILFYPYLTQYLRLFVSFVKFQFSLVHPSSQLALSFLNFGQGWAGTKDLRIPIYEFFVVFAIFASQLSQAAVIPFSSALKRKTATCGREIFHYVSDKNQMVLIFLCLKIFFQFCICTLPTRPLCF